MTGSRVATGMGPGPVVGQQQEDVRPRLPRLHGGRAIKKGSPGDRHGFSRNYNLIERQSNPFRSPSDVLFPPCKHDKMRLNPPMAPMRISRTCRSLALILAFAAHSGLTSAR